MDLTEIILRSVGAFYTFAGLIATQVAITAHFFDKAIAAISLKRMPTVERHRFLWLLGSAALVLAGGVALMTMLYASVWLFAASALGQAVYLTVLAPRYFDREDPPDAKGRQQTINAFIIYCAATAFVLWADFTGRLMPWHDTSWALIAVLAVSALAYAIHVARRLRWHPQQSSAPDLSDDGGSFSPDANPALSRRVKVMADYDCHPLWALDEGHYGCFAPEELGLSPELAGDLGAWADAFTASLNRDDPANSLWTDEQQRAHDEQGRTLARRLARERPDLMVYVMDREVGVVEVHAEDPPQPPA